jgi:hypothetical protein
VIGLVSVTLRCGVEGGENEEKYPKILKIIEYGAV